VVRSGTHPRVTAISPQPHSSSQESYQSILDSNDSNGALQSVGVYAIGNSPVVPGGTFTLCEASGGAGSNSNGYLDEVRVSNVVRTADWIATEYNNQNSPATFYSLSPEQDVVVPASVGLSASESQQFTVPLLGDCASPAMTWSINPAGVGTMSASGLYTAPATIATEQTVTVTATSVADTLLTTA